MLENVWNNIILLNLRDFENISVDFYINIFLFFLALAIVACAFVFEYSRGVMHVAVKQLLRHGALGEGEAKTLSKLGLADNKMVKLFLSRDTRLSKLLSRVGAPDVKYEDFVKMKRAEQKELFRVDFSKDRFYISDENSDQANRVFSSYAFSLPRFLLFALLVFLLWGAIAAFSYELISYIDSVLLNK
ncbi:MAG: hypothetical protein IJW48_01565 [Clostridia bacterium]|nr:hypothetical protein [Clostridia bacterium]